MTNIRPLNDRVIVRRFEGESTSAGGIALPGAAAETPARGEVLAVGPGKYLDNGEVRACELKAGDKVVFGQYGGTTVTVNNEELLILGENEIFGVLED